MSLRLSGNYLIVAYDQLNVWRECRWSLPALNLVPDRQYSLGITGHEVEVSLIGRG